MNIIDALTKWEARLEKVERDIDRAEDDEGKAWRVHLGDTVSELRRDIREVRLRLLRAEARE